MDMKTVSSNYKSENLNPCFEEGKLSTKCMKQNNFDSEKCVYYFENYRNCLRFWSTVKRIRINNNVRPFMPDKDEREKILKEREKGINTYKAK